MAPRTTAGQAFIHLLKGYIGPGCLSLPWAVSQVGFLGGAIAIAIMSFWSSYNCWTIVKIKRYIERANMENFRVNETDETKSAKSETASSVASSALTYPDFLALCICTQQLAICTVFFSFIGENIYAVCELVPEAVPSIFTSHIGVMTVALPFIMGLSFIPSLDALTPVMVAGTLLLFSGFGVVGYVISLVWEDRPTDPVDIQWKSAPLALCAILYSYEGICLILPIESSMAEPKKFKMVFWSAMFCIALILATVSMVCVYAFGEVTNGSVTAFLLEEYKGNTSVIVFLMVANTAVSLSVLFTYPIQLFPTLEILGPKFTKCSFMSNITEVFPKMTIPGDSLLLRVCLVILTYTVAVIVPNVQALISLAGAVAGSSSALLIPPMLELALIEHLETQPDVTKSPKISNPSFRQSMSAQNPSLLMSLWRHDLSGKYWKMKLKCYCSFWMGFIFFLIGAYASIADILSIWTSKD
ncbi:amino acid/polyamine transporter [Thalassiosira pseudonana CCMP1335]|uniref:Amino acid/polyamine transporter n=1 Tax=Thalassiosira pseudonana TaxID=35128 RepID=B8C1U0_THAPS|nr:amino acid/polyamine transporter [Thalassiosira pseudonana CCMP1335]EED92278.1 amino acid/polyamine transporter [Thalassiosira pseudonana CCMP1335]